MEKLGFKKYDDWYQHKDYPKLQFHKDVTWDKIIQETYRLGFYKGKHEVQYEMKQALGIYS